MLVLLTPLLPIAPTFGSFTWPTLSGLRRPLPLRLTLELLLLGLEGVRVWLALLLDGAFVLLLRMLLALRDRSAWAAYFARSSLARSARFRATFLASLRIWCSLLFRHPKKLIFLIPFLILLLFLYIRSNPPICYSYVTGLNQLNITFFIDWR